MMTFTPKAFGTLSVDYFVCNYDKNNDIPYLNRITFSVKMLLLSLTVLLKSKFIKLMVKLQQEIWVNPVKDSTTIWF